MYEEVGRPRRRLHGAYALVRLFRTWAAAVPDSHASVVAEIAGEGGVAVEIEWLPEGDAPVGDHALARPRPAIRTVLMLWVHGGRVTGLRHSYDALAAHRALGLGPL